MKMAIGRMIITSKDNLSVSLVEARADSVKRVRSNEGSCASGDSHPMFFLTYARLHLDRIRTPEGG